ncbi:adenine deaminase [Cytophagaceae bacterium ABcell3]|nr:adenine deaminase [Cytophagaceae bacterium ABcell3]
MKDFTISGNIIDIINKRTYPGTITVSDGKIVQISQTANADDIYILPGFIDAHVHIESSMVVPSEFAKVAVVHGTVATVSDPHEIANVLGIQGINYMIDNGKTVPFKFYFGAPSCVPATTFETAGAEVTAGDIEKLFKERDLKYLGEMMNWPGVLNQDPTVLAKIHIAKKYNKIIDGHAPGLKGALAEQYASAGISTDHECFTKDEALDKLKAGMKIAIREGSAAKNFEALYPLLNDYEDHIMFCSDDKHPDYLVKSHIDELVKRSIAKGVDFYKVLKAACVNPVIHYDLDVGLVREGDPADFIVVNNIKEFSVLKTYINGELQAENGKSFIKTKPADIINKFDTSLKTPEFFKIAPLGNKIKVIEALDGQLITNALEVEPTILNGELQADINKDLLKITVVNRYKNTPPAIAFIKGFGLKKGAIASSVAHDSHNIVAVGTTDIDLTKAVNEVIKNKGGISAVFDEKTHSLPLPVAGLMSIEDGYTVAKKYTEMDSISKEMGSPLTSPFMTLSFMALLVIPALKLSDLGLFDAKDFKFVEQFKTINQQ